MRSSELLTVVATSLLVPLEVYGQWQRRRRAFFDHVRQVSEQASVAEEEAEVLVAEAVQAVRGNG